MELATSPCRLWSCQIRPQFLFDLKGNLVQVKQWLEEDFPEPDPKVINFNYRLAVRAALRLSKLLPTVVIFLPVKPQLKRLLVSFLLL
jgi:hypothetical protein